MFGLKSKVVKMLGLVCLSAGSALAQPTTANPFKVDQRWIPRLASFSSIVQNCNGTQYTFAPVAMDDFLCTKDGPLVRMEWWGTMDLATLPVQRRFFIQIWGHSGTSCRPTQPLWKGCVNATYKVVGTDCQQRRVYQFAANLPQPWFVQTAGNRYWVQISELDNGNPAGSPPSSPRIGQVDWRWSGHRNIKNCPAGQFTAAGAFISPLLDPCDQQPDDLAFRIYSRVITGTIPGLPTTPTARGFLRSTFSVDLYLPNTSQLVESHNIDIDEEGNFAAYPDAPDGQYDIRIRGMSSPGLLLPAVQITDGEILDTGALTLPKGDANSDGTVNFADLTSALSNFLTMAP